MSLRRRAAVLVGAIAIDLVLGDAPDRWHPVAWFGNGANAAIARLPRGGFRRDLRSGLVLAAGGCLRDFLSQTSPGFAPYRHFPTASSHVTSIT